MTTEGHKQPPVLQDIKDITKIDKGTLINLNLGTTFFSMDARDSANNQVIYYDAGQENHTINQRDINLPVTVMVKVMHPNNEQGTKLELSLEQLAELQETITNHFRVKPEKVVIKNCDYPALARSIELTFPAGTPIERISYGYESISMVAQQARTEQRTHKGFTR